MPLGGLVTAGISAGTSILGGVLGGKGAKKAGQTLSAAGTKVSGDITSAANTGTSGIKDAAGAGVAGIDAGVQGVQAAAGSANDVLAKTLAGEQGNLDPYLAAGKQGVTSLASALAPGGSLAGQFTGPNPQDISSTPEYQFQLQQGLQALTRAAAATGGVQGGGTLKGITQYGQGLASTAYQQAYNNAFNTYQANRQNTLQGLTSLTGIGQNALGLSQSAAQNAGNLQSGNIFGAGQLGLQGATSAGQLGLSGAQSAGQLGLSGAQSAGQAYMQGQGGLASGQVGQANAWNSALGGVGNAAMGYGAQQAFGYGNLFGGVGSGLPSYQSVAGGIPAGGYGVGTNYQPPPMPSMYSVSPGIPVGGYNVGTSYQPAPYVRPNPNGGVG